MARSFTGTNPDKVDTGTGWTHPTTGCTTSLWINPTSFANAYNCLLQANDGAGGSFQIYLKSTGKLAWYPAITSGFQSFVDPGSATLTAGVWYNLIMRFRSGINIVGMQGYVNANIDAATTTTNWTMVTIAAGTPINMGYDRITAGRGFTGKIADVAVWTTFLSDGEVAALAKGLRPYMIQPGSLVSYFPLDGLQSPESDLSGFAQNGTLTGTAFAVGPPIAMFTPKPPSRFDVPAIAAQIFSFDQMTTSFTRQIEYIGTP